VDPRAVLDAVVPSHFIIHNHPIIQRCITSATDKVSLNNPINSGNERSIGFTPTMHDSVFTTHTHTHTAQFMV
jgi:hypothetical protein